MEIIISYCSVYLGLVMADETKNGCEIIGAEKVVTDGDPNIMMMILSQADHINCYASSNPFCHELILPYRDQILADLTKSIFGKDESDNPKFNL